MTRLSGLKLTIYVIVALLSFISLVSESSARQEVSNVGWDQREPYHYAEERGPSEYLTGIDIEVLRLIEDTQTFEFNFEKISWTQNLAGLKNGEIDIAPGASRDTVRESYALFSIPYRVDRQVLFVRSDSSNGPITSVGIFKNLIQDGKLKVGIVDGYYYGGTLSAFLLDPKNAASIIKVDSEELLVNGMMHDEFDAFIADRLVGIQSVVAHHLSDEIQETKLVLSETDVHFLFSKAKFSIDQVQQFNKTLGELIKSGKIERTIRHFAEPIAFSVAIATHWYLFLDIVGTIAFAISGVLIARKENYSVLGAFVLAALPAVGGGVVRDLLVGRDPIGILQTPLYLILIIGTVVIGFTFDRLGKWVKTRFVSVSAFLLRNLKKIRQAFPKNLFEVFDAIGLASFTVTGVAIASRYATEPIWLWGPILAGLTGAGGGILRDVIRADSDNPALKSSLYAEIAIIWGFLLSSYIHYVHDAEIETATVEMAVIVTVMGVFFSRMLVVIFNVRTVKY